MTSLFSFITVAVAASLYIFGSVSTSVNTPYIEHELFREYNSSVSEDGHTCVQFGILPASVEPCGE